jgi:hypothetical protein
MSEHVAILLAFGVALPAALIVVCAVAFVGYRYGLRFEIRRRRSARGLVALPPQPAPQREYVELSSAEQDAFQGLVRRLNDGH